MAGISAVRYLNTYGIGEWLLIKILRPLRSGRAGRAHCLQLNISEATPRTRSARIAFRSYKQLLRHRHLMVAFVFHEAHARAHDQFVAPRRCNTAKRRK